MVVSIALRLELLPYAILASGEVLESVVDIIDCLVFIERSYVTCLRAPGIHTVPVDPPWRGSSMPIFSFGFRCGAVISNLQIANNSQTYN